MSAEKRSATEAGLEDVQPAKISKPEEEVSQEDIEEALFCVSKAAARAREHLVNKATELFSNRNGRNPQQEELNDIFNTLRDSMMDDEENETDKEDETADDGPAMDVEEDEKELKNLQSDVESAYENVRDLGRAAAKDLKAHLKTLWTTENNGGEPSPEQIEAVLYHLKHLVVGCVVVEDEDDQAIDEDYKPSELEKESAEAEAEPCTEKEAVQFDFENQVEVGEEKFEELVKKFCDEKGREPTSEEADALLSSFKTPITEATFDEHDDVDYVKEEEPASEDEDDLEEDKSLQAKAEATPAEATVETPAEPAAPTAEETEPQAEAETPKEEAPKVEAEKEDAMDVEEDEGEAGESSAFQYMRELEEGDTKDVVEEATIDATVDAAKEAQAEAANQAAEIVA